MNDPEAAADVFAFADDQVDDLIVHGMQQMVHTKVQMLRRQFLILQQTRDLRMYRMQSSLQV